MLETTRDQEGHRGAFVQGFTFSATPLPPLPLRSLSLLGVCCHLVATSGMDPADQGKHWVLTVCSPHLVILVQR